MKLQSNSARYLEDFTSWYPYYMSAIQEATTKGELKSAKDSAISELKRMEYPKVSTRELVAYIKQLKGAF